MTHNVNNEQRKPNEKHKTFDFNKIPEKNYAFSMKDVNKSLKDNNNNIANQDSKFFRSSVSNIRSYGMSEYQSSSTLRYSVNSWTIPKSDRFKELYNASVISSMYDLPDFKSTRKTSPGYGKKWELKPISGECSPPPNKYHIKSQFETNVEKKKGYSIRTKNSYNDEFGKELPGPGKYDLKYSPDTKKIPILIKSRQLFFYDEDLKKSEHCVSPEKYSPKTNLQQNTRFNKITFGIGNRYDFINGKNIPGPGRYDLPSVFDRNRRTKPPLN